MSRGQMGSQSRTDQSHFHLLPLSCVCGVTGGEDTEEVLGWATGAKYDLKKPALFGV